MIKCILFDFDGTIIDSNRIILDALSFAVEKASGRKPKRSEIDNALGHILPEQMEILNPTNPELAGEYYKSYYRKHMDDMTELFPDVIDTMKEIKKRGIVNAIISNKGINGINHGLDKFNLREFFSVIISAYDVDNAKPHPEAAYKALKQCNASPMETLMIGDSPHDIQCGKNAGIKTVLVDWTIYPKDGFSNIKPDYIVKSFGEILDLI